MADDHSSAVTEECHRLEHMKRRALILAGLEPFRLGQKLALWLETTQPIQDCARIIKAYTLIFYGRSQHC